MTTADNASTLSRPVALLVQVVASLLVTAVLLGAIELVAARYVRRLKEAAGTKPAPDDAVTQTLTWLEANPAPLAPSVDFLWHNQPLARRTQLVNPQPYGRHQNWTIENNSVGYRGPEVAAGAQHPGVYRILCIGDSVTFGFNADQNDTYPGQLTRLLAQRHPGAAIEVINAGVPGWSWLQGLRFLETEGIGLHPDAVLIGHGTNDQFFKARVTDQERFHALGSPVQRILQRTQLLLSATNTYQAVDHLIAHRPIDELSPACKQQLLTGPACRRVSLDEIEAAVHQVRHITDRAGADLLVLNLDFTETAAVKGSRRATELDGTPFLDLVRNMNALRTRREAVIAARLRLGPRDGTPGLRDRRDRAAPPTALFRVATWAPGHYTVKGHVDYREGTEFSADLYDDGTHGDEIAGDGVFSAWVPISAGTAVHYEYFVDDTPELIPRPPFGALSRDRRFSIADHLVGPVDRFGRMLFMAEVAHPNASGHFANAKAIVKRLERLPSFQQRVR